ncbi:MAG TPA: glycerophosphodiester phosphodiesterase [Gemmatimonadaceae bacterium]|nr:glycerophosphodiester phosphodiesterase [Gemmatimonadaceae bacterium]
MSHRGAHDTAPENSIEAFERAIELGAEAVELDVHASSDGVVVVHHDPVLYAGDVPRSETVRISATPFDALKRHHLSSGISIPTLAQALDVIGTRAVVFVEIKAIDIEPHVVRCIRESGADCAVHSFDHRIVANVKKMFPAIRCGVLQVARHLDPVASLRATGAEDLWQHVDFIDADLVGQAHAIGARVIAWTANDSAQWRFLAGIGVDGVCTDRIGDLAAATG